MPHPYDPSDPAQPGGPSGSSASSASFDGGADTGLLSPVRAGTPTEAALCDRAWLQALLDAESALGRAQAGLGSVPLEAVRAITRAARADHMDIRALAVEARETANPVVGVVRALSSLVAADDPAAAEYVHRGSTSQDIFDTGAMLVCVRALRLTVADLDRSAEALAELAERHQDTVMAGRTLALHAVPTTFGLKAAGWRQSLLDARQRVDRVLASLPVSLGGASGTLAGYLEYAALHDGRRPDPGEYLDRLTDAYAAETGLARPVLPWHALRTPIADLAAVLALTAGVLGKIAVDVLTLSRTEIGEVAEPHVAGRGGSSAMPHKRNPVLSTMIRSAALQVPSLAAGLTQCLASEDERSAGAWHAEWLLLRECLRLTGGAAHTAAELTEGLVVRPDRMHENLGLTGSLMMSERIAAVLAQRIGKARAKQLLTEAASDAARTGKPLAQVAGALPEVAAHLSTEEVEALLEPAEYTGAARALVVRASGA
ncbi:3-carboxy-cis,cis-muconate cycloisomerase [Streptomyces iconiensis]|uniref:3-carboxy-cis,cis-muconate cycloisomerase n=1 Tax=Streptomyces iconiensis TaxID=1384038 RepID=A0ABT7A0G1_9ACTN|nr:3-carboxy-cis,cis-muconate cycloisomerase [Streptomyces iconiensis]MDJ1134791.1 3-carboxy-cis,cis-muconate cycloisomerase [Streptomyces iconiensis]